MYRTKKINITSWLRLCVYIVLSAKNFFGQLALHSYKATEKEITKKQKGLWIIYQVKNNPEESLEEIFKKSHNGMTTLQK